MVQRAVKEHSSLLNRAAVRVSVLANKKATVLVLRGLRQVLRKKKATEPGVYRGLCKRFLLTYAQVHSDKETAEPPLSTAFAIPLVKMDVYLLIRSCPFD